MEANEVAGSESVEVLCSPPGEDLHPPSVCHSVRYRGLGSVTKLRLNIF